MTDYFARDDGDDLDDALSDANAVKSPSVLETKMSAAADRGRFNRADLWGYAAIGSSALMLLYLSTAGSGSALGSRTRIDAYGSGAKPILDWEWNYPGDFAPAISMDADYQRVTDIELRRVGPQNSGSDVGGMGCHNSAAVLSPEWYGVVVSGTWRSGLILEDCYGSGVADGCTITDTNRCAASGFNWGFGMGVIRTLNGPVVSVVLSNNLVYSQWGEGCSTGTTEDTTIENNWVWGNKAMGYYLEGSRTTIVRLNRCEGTTDTTYHRSGNACGPCYGYDIEPGNSTGRAQQADDGTVQIYLNLGSYCISGIYWPSYGHPDAGPPQNISFDHMILVDNNVTFESYNPETSTSGCSVRCNISKPLSIGTLHDNGNGFHADVNINFNYWDTTQDAAPHTDFQGSSDQYGTTHLLQKNTGWRSTSGTVVASDYTPQSRLQATDLNYDRDFDTTPLTSMDEFGAFYIGESGGGGGAQAIRVERHVVDFGASSDTASLTFTTAGSAANRVWPHLRNVRYASAGPVAGTSSQETIATMGIHISSITASGLTLNRHSSGSNVDVRVYIEVWFYDGSGGGANEFIVRWSGTVSIGSASLSATQAISSVSDAGDLVAENLGVTSDAPGGYSHFCRLSLGGTTTLTFKRDSHSGVAATAAGIVVEMLGSNWQVEERDHTFGAWNTTESETISTISAWTNAFIVASLEATDDENNEIGFLTWPGSSATSIRFRQNSSSGTGALGIATAFVVKNSEMIVDHYDTVTGGSSAFGTSSNPSAQTASITAIDDLDLAGFIMYGTMDESSYDATPDGWFNYRLTSTTQFEIWRSRASDDEMHWAAEVVDFAAMAEGSEPIQGSTTFTFSVSGASTVSGQMSAATTLTFTVTGAMESPTPAELSAFAGSRDFDYVNLALDSDAVELVVFAYLDFEGEPTFIHSALGIISWGNEDWLGVGNFGSVSPVVDALGVASPSRFKLTLFPVAAELLNSAVNEDTWGRVCEIYLGAVNSDGMLVGTPELMTRGLMGAPEAVIGDERGSITVTVEDVKSLLNRSNGLRCSLHDHQAQVPGDKFYEWLPRMLDHKFIFNGVVQGSRRTPGNTWTYDNNWTPPP